MQKEEEKGGWLSQQSPAMQAVMKHLIDITFRPKKFCTPVSSESSPAFVAMYAFFHLFLQPRARPGSEKITTKQTKVLTMAQKILL
jgi:hypothetical protein